MFHKTLAIAATSFLLLAVSCKKDNNTSIPTPGPAKSRAIKFEVTGNFSGTLDATYIAESGGGTSEDINSLPWNKSLNYATTASGTGLSVGGYGGVPGQTLTVKVFAGGNEVSSTSGTTKSDGIIVVVAPSYVF